MASRLTTYLVVLIVTGTVVAGLIVGAQRDDASGPVDLIVTNGRVFTGADRELAEAVAIRGNRILQVGSNREIKRLRRPHTLMVDARGGSVLPGFIDAHVHLGDAARSLAGVDLADALSVETLQARVREFAGSHPEAEWIRGRGWSYEAFPDGLPTRQLIDEVVPDRPAYLIAEDGRTALANSKALAAAGITRHTPSPRGGMIVRDPRTGEPTGALRDTAQSLVSSALPEPTMAEQLEGLQAAIREAHSAGVTSVHSIGDTVDDLELYDALRAAGALQLRVYSALAASSLPVSNPHALDALEERFPDDPLLKTGAVAVRATTPPPLTEAATGEAGQPHLLPVMKLFDDRGWQLLLEAMTRDEVEAAIAAVEAVEDANAPPARPRRHRLDSPVAVEEELVHRLAELGVVVSILPGIEEQLSAGLQVLAAGGRVAFGSDWPAGALNACGVFATDASADDIDRSAPAEESQDASGSLGVADAIEAWTSTAAMSSFDDQRKGRIARGMLADLVILDSDILRTDRAPGQPQVETTIFDGRVVFTRAGAAAGTQ